MFSYLYYTLFFFYVSLYCMGQQCVFFSNVSRRGKDKKKWISCYLVYFDVFSSWCTYWAHIVVFICYSNVLARLIIPSFCFIFTKFVIFVIHFFLVFVISSFASICYYFFYSFVIPSFCIIWLSKFSCTFQSPCACSQMTENNTRRQRRSSSPCDKVKLARDGLGPHNWLGNLGEWRP